MKRAIYFSKELISQVKPERLISLAAVGVFVSALAMPASALEDAYGIELPSQALTSAASASDADDRDRSAPDNSPTLTSTDEMGDMSAASMRRTAEYLTKKGQYDEAIRLIRLSLQKNYDDSDSHKAYAIALEKKLSTQVDRDPTLFAQCVKEWLILLREEVGLEKLTFHGLNAPLVGSFFADETFAIPAKSHLQSLTGATPRAWETDTQFLKRVTKADTVNVAAKVLKKHGAKTAVEQD